MQQILLFVFCLLTVVCNLHGQDAPIGVAKVTLDGDLSSLRKLSEETMLLFNRGEADELASRFLIDGELVDERGVVHVGQAEIKNLFTGFFSKFQATKLEMNIDSLRVIGSVAIEDGSRTISAADGVTKTQFRYQVIWSKVSDGWKIASFRDSPMQSSPSAHDAILPLEWMVGEWVNEGSDGRVSLTFRWSTDQNYLLGEYSVSSADKSMRSSSQRIAWDPSSGRIRSWIFDSDGGFTEGVGTIVDEGLLIKSNSVNPDGSSASATITLKKKGNDSFIFSGISRIIDGKQDPDIELTIVRKNSSSRK